MLKSDFLKEGVRILGRSLSQLGTYIRSIFLVRRLEAQALFQRMFSSPRAISLTLIGTISVIGGLVVWIKLFVPQLATNLPILSPIPDYIISLLWCSGLAIFLFMLPMSSRKIILALWGVRCVVALGPMLLYEAYYELHDAIRYFSAANAPSYTWSWFQLGSGSWNLERLVWLQLQVLGPSYHAVKVTFAFLGLLGTYFFYRAASEYLKRDARIILIALGLVPSIVFWSSTLGKDPVMFLALGLYAYGAAIRYRRRQKRGWLWAGLGIAMAAYIRVWMAMIMVAAMIVLVLSTMRRWTLRAAVIVAAGILIVVFGGRTMERVGLESFDALLPKLTEVVQGLSQGGSAQVLEREFRTWWDVIAFVPRGAFSALFKPLPWEAHNLYMFAAGIESLALLVWVIFSLLRLRVARLRNPFVLWGLVYLAAWTFVYSFLSYGNLGAGFRFRLQAMPFLLGLSLELGWRNDPVQSEASLDRVCLEPNVESSSEDV